MNKVEINRRRIAYLSGPVNALEVLNNVHQGKAQEFFGTSYLEQFYRVCANYGAEALVITTLPGVYQKTSAGNVTVENRPLPDHLRGVAFHLANAVWMIRCMVALWRFGPNVLLVTAQQNYWFMLAPLVLRKILIVASLHCVLWPKINKVRWWLRLLLPFNALFLRYCVSRIMAVSEDIADQVRALTNKLHPVYVFLPTYRRDQFASVLPSTLGNRINILFAGRIEVNKGIFDVLKIAKRLTLLYPRKFHFDICGEGSKARDLIEAISVDADLRASVTYHGNCGRVEMLRRLSDSNMVLVPTRSDFEEGFNKVCAEGILAGRPVVTSSVCPALSTIRPAAIECPPDDPDEYLKSIVRLSQDEELYRAKVVACGPLAEQFYDISRSWGCTFERVLSEIGNNSEE